MSDVSIPFLLFDIIPQKNDTNGSTFILSFITEERLARSAKQSIVSYRLYWNLCSVIFYDDDILRYIHNKYKLQYYRWMSDRSNGKYILFMGNKEYITLYEDANILKYRLDGRVCLLNEYDTVIHCLGFCTGNLYYIYQKSCHIYIYLKHMSDMEMTKLVSPNTCNDMLKYTYDISVFACRSTHNTLNHSIYVKENGDMVVEKCTNGGVTEMDKQDILNCFIGNICHRNNTPNNITADCTTSFRFMTNSDFYSYEHQNIMFILLEENVLKLEVCKTNISYTHLSLIGFPDIDTFFHDCICDAIMFKNTLFNVFIINNRGMCNIPISNILSIICTISLLYKSADNFSFLCEPNIIHSIEPTGQFGGNKCDNKGGLILEPVYGVWKMVVEYDAVSMYPQILIYLLSRDVKYGVLNVYFKHFIDYKACIEDKNDPRYTKIKYALNVPFGLLWKKCKCKTSLSHINYGEQITEIGRKCLNSLKEHIERNKKSDVISVIMGCTDSLFIRISSMDNMGSINAIVDNWNNRNIFKLTFLKKKLFDIFIPINKINYISVLQKEGKCVIKGTCGMNNRNIPQHISKLLKCILQEVVLQFCYLDSKQVNLNHILRNGIAEYTHILERDPTIIMNHYSGVPTNYKLLYNAVPPCQKCLYHNDKNDHLYELEILNLPEKYVMSLNHILDHVCLFMRRGDRSRYIFSSNCISWQKECAEIFRQEEFITLMFHYIDMNSAYSNMKQYIMSFIDLTVKSINRYEKNNNEDEAAVSIHNFKNYLNAIKESLERSISALSGDGVYI